MIGGGTTRDSSRRIAAGISRQCARTRNTEGEALGKPNYQFERRQKDLAKKKKAEEKRLRKAEKGKSSPPEESAEPSPVEEGTPS
jgi:hypothetical protein